MKVPWFLLTALLSFSAVAEEVCLPLLMKRAEIKEGKEIPLRAEDLIYKVAGSDTVVKKLTADTCAVKSNRLNGLTTCSSVDLEAQILTCQTEVGQALGLNADGSPADANILFSAATGAVLLDLSLRATLPQGKRIQKWPVPSHPLSFPLENVQMALSKKGDRLQLKLSGAVKKTLSCKNVVLTDSKVLCDGAEAFPY